MGAPHRAPPSPDAPRKGGAIVSGGAFSAVAFSAGAASDGAFSASAASDGAFSASAASDGAATGGKVLSLIVPDSDFFSESGGSVPGEGSSFEAINRPG
jgi:hypothetical protein